MNQSENIMDSHLDKKAWQDWLNKAQWTITEAAALSVGVPPEAVEIQRHTIPVTEMTEEVWNWVHGEHASETASGFVFDQPSSIPPMPHQDDKPPMEYWTVALKADQARYGKTIEALLQKRMQDSLLGGKLAGIHGVKLDPSELRYTPRKIIEAMRYEEWELPAEMLGEERAPSSNPPKAAIDLNRYLAELNHIIYIEDAKILAGVKDDKTLKKYYEDGLIPAPRKTTVASTGGRLEWTKKDWVDCFKKRELDPQAPFDEALHKKAILRVEQRKLDRDREKAKK